MLNKHTDQLPKKTIGHKDSQLGFFLALFYFRLFVIKEGIPSYQPYLIFTSLYA